MKIFKITFSFLLISILAGCAQNTTTHTTKLPPGPPRSIKKQVIGHNTEVILMNTMNSTQLTYLVSRKMEKYDRQQLNHVYERGTPNQGSSWLNPDTGNQYTVTPGLVYLSPNGGICRKNEIVTTMDGKKQSISATACRDDSGSWRIFPQ